VQAVLVPKLVVRQQFLYLLLNLIVELDNRNHNNAVYSPHRLCNFRCHIPDNEMLLLRLLATDYFLPRVVGKEVVVE
jgi:hypothetical protein